MGLTSGQTTEQWQKDISAAKASSVDGFALNIGPNDAWTQTQLQLAYSAAEAAGGFSMFISFDFAAGSWSVDYVASLINQFKGSSAQMKENGATFVSTFEGPYWSDSWSAVRQQTGGIFLVPTWSSIGAAGVGSKIGLIDGAFHWGVWPRPNQYKLDTGEDMAYKGALQGKKYMMGVSPWFYTGKPV